MRSNDPRRQWPFSALHSQFPSQMEPPSFRSFGPIGWIVSIGMVLTFGIVAVIMGRHFMLESGVGAPEAQGRGEADARRYAEGEHPGAAEVIASCVVQGGDDMPCTVRGRTTEGAFSESVRCRTSIAIGPRGCWRAIDRTVTLEPVR